MATSCSQLPHVVQSVYGSVLKLMPVRNPNSLVMPLFAILPEQAPHIAAEASVSDCSGRSCLGQCCTLSEEIWSSGSKADQVRLVRPSSAVPMLFSKVPPHASPFPAQSRDRPPLRDAPSSHQAPDLSLSLGLPLSLSPSTCHVRWLALSCLTPPPGCRTLAPGSSPACPTTTARWCLACCAAALLYSGKSSSKAV